MPADEGAEHDARHAEVPEHRVLDRRQGRRDARDVEPLAERAEDLSDPEVDRTGGDPDEERDDQEADRRDRPGQRQPAWADDLALGLRGGDLHGRNLRRAGD